MRKRNKERLIASIEKAIKKNQDMKVKYSELLKKELQKVGEKVIDEWYEDYIPNAYRRQYSLYKAFKVSVNRNKGIFNISFSHTYMKNFKHFTGKKTTDINEYIFDISFMQGWHGGANKGKEHPFPGIPFYREPFPYYTSWYYIAEKSFSPYEKMYEKMNGKIEEIDHQYDEEFQNKIVNNIKKHIK